jgi:CheY-like chemotaxis protein
MIALQNCSILVVEDEPLIALDVAHAFQNAGAQVATTHTVRDALALAENNRFSAAIIDHALSDGDSSTLREKLSELGPFLNYSGREYRGQRRLGHSNLKTRHIRNALVRSRAPA